MLIRCQNDTLLSKLVLIKVFLNGCYLFAFTFTKLATRESEMAHVVPLMSPLKSAGLHRTGDLVEYRSAHVRRCPGTR